MKEDLKVLIIDEEILTHIGLKTIINSNWKNVKFLSEDTSSKNALKTNSLIIHGMISGCKPSVITLLKDLRKKFPHSGILILTRTEDPKCVIPYLKNGANGYLSKNTSEAEIILAIEAILEKKEFFCGNLIKQKLLDDFLGT